MGELHGSLMTEFELAQPPQFRGVPCQNSFTPAGLAFPARYAALRYSLISPDDAPALDPGGDIDGVAGQPQRGFLLPALVRTVAVIVPRVLGEHLPQMLLAEDQHVVQALAAQCSHESLGE